jgi:hypothetical protein
MNYSDLVDWLFEKTSLKPQLGFAGQDKRAWLWLPGKAAPRAETITRAMSKAPLKGCSGCAYEDYFKPMTGQRCEICFVALDIDADDNPEGINLEEIRVTYPSMVRTSCSGKGYHVIYRLAEPIFCTHETANQITKHITAPIVASLKTVKVCKADKRLMWLSGGANQIIQQSDRLLEVNIGELALWSAVQEIQKPQVELVVTPLIRDWLTKLGVAYPRKSIPIYIGSVVECLRGLGEKVETKSACSGNGQVNGYLDITPTSISLWSYADGFAIWNFTDVEALLA